MKQARKTMILFIMAVLFTLVSSAIADEPVEGLRSAAHIYEVLPGTVEWAAMTPEQRFASCAVSEEEVAGMTTGALVKTVLNYPFLVDMFAYDTPEMGITVVSSYFPALPELFSRADAAIVLRSYLSKNSSFHSTSNPF